MDLTLSVLLLTVGAVALYFGSNWLVDGAAALALRYGVRPLVIGLTVVAVGTSSPETVLAILTSLEGNNAVSLGNVIGANISNAALVLGAACLMGPVAMKLRNLKRESVFLLVSGPLLLALAWDGRLDAVDGAVMLVVLLAFFYTLYRAACRGEACAVVTEELERVEEVKRRSGPVAILFILAGMALLALGAEAVVEGATGLALGVGVSQEVVGLTIVGLGTTIPELTIAVTGSRKGQSDVVLGNVVGTIIVNTLLILGLGAVIGGYNTAGLETALGMGVMIALSTTLVILLAVQDRAGKRTGAALLAAFGGYLAAVVLLL